MTRAAILTHPDAPPVETPHLWRRAFESRRVAIGGGILLAIVLLSLLTLPWTACSKGAIAYNDQKTDISFEPPGRGGMLGTDMLGRSLLGRCLMGGAVSVGIGLAAAFIATVVGVCVGLFSGYRGGWVDALLMRGVDILYGLPYILLILLFKIGFEDPLARVFSAKAANLIVLFLAIGSVSWLTMARVIRGQVLSLRTLPFIEAARAAGLRERHIFLNHLLPNLVGPITVYASLVVPAAILQESFLSFLGVGIQPPVPSWGSLASEGLKQLDHVNNRWWLLLFPCILLAVTLLSLNFVGDGLRDVFDPKREAAKI